MPATTFRMLGREELASCLIYQIGALNGFLDAEGMTLNLSKPRGSLYGMAARQPGIANAICDAADVFKVPLLGMIDTLHATVYLEHGHALIAEFYADLDYADDGSLIITREHPPVAPQKTAKRCLRAIREGLVNSIGGKDIPRQNGNDLCVQSDTPGADQVVRVLRETLQAKGILSTTTHALKQPQLHLEESENGR
jgi:5-oxoprolinase (ATP-hydrolysing) subunit A